MSTLTAKKVGNLSGSLNFPGGEVRGCFPQKAGDEINAVSGAIYFMAGQPNAPPRNTG